MINFSNKMTQLAFFDEGSLVVGGAADDLYCWVWNMSDTGAVVEVKAGIEVPDSFSLVTTRGSVNLRCEVVRRAGQRFGVSFLH